APPTISNIPGRSVAAGATVGPVNFTIGDTVTPAANLTVSAASSDLSAIPLSAISFGGSGADRTITVQTIAGINATTTITVTVTDVADLTASDDFVIQQTVPNQPPTISDVPDQNVVVSAPVGPLDFTIGDDATPTGSLTVAA